MPELPEVETIKRVLEPQLFDRTIREVFLNRPEIIGYPSAELFQSGVTGARISGMDRRGKFLLICLGGKRIVLHLRMTGRLLLVPSGFPEEKHTHIVFSLNGKTELRFIDPRRFGRFWLIGNGEEDTKSGVHKLGPEPFDPALDGLICSLRAADGSGPSRSACSTRACLPGSAIFMRTKSCLHQKSVRTGRQIPLPQPSGNGSRKRFPNV